MKTSALIELLATGASAQPLRRVGPHLARAVTLGLLASFAFVVLVYHLLPNLTQVVQLPMFWVKLGLAASVAAAGMVLTARLARPGTAARRGWWGVALPVALIWVLAALEWFAAAPGARAALLWGSTWRSCPWSIGLIGLPVFVAAFAVLRDGAPTQARWAGAAAGALAGGAGAAVYALHCPELTAPFMAVWYVLGMALPALVGAALGPRLLRW